MEEDETRLTIKNKLITCEGRLEQKLKMRVSDTKETTSRERRAKTGRGNLYNRNCVHYSTGSVSTVEDNNATALTNEMNLAEKCFLILVLAALNLLHSEMGNSVFL